MAGEVRLPYVAVITLAALLFVGVAAPAAQARDATCAEAVLEDWSDGRIDGVYEAHCYLGAIEILPEDVRAYTSAEEDIAHALHASRLPPRAAGAAPDEAVAGASGAVPAASAGGSLRSVPTAIVALAALALAVLLAGSAGLAARRLRVRRRP